MANSRHTEWKFNCGEWARDSPRIEALKKVDRRATRTSASPMVLDQAGGLSSVRGLSGCASIIKDRQAGAPLLLQGADQDGPVHHTRPARACECG